MKVTSRSKASRSESEVFFSTGFVTALQLMVASTSCSLSNVHVAGEVPEWAGQVTSVAAVTHLLPQDITVKGDAEV